MKNSSKPIHEDRLSSLPISCRFGFGRLPPRHTATRLTTRPFGETWIFLDGREKTLSDQFDTITVGLVSSHSLTSFLRIYFVCFLVILHAACSQGGDSSPTTDDDAPTSDAAHEEPPGDVEDSNGSDTAEELPTTEDAVDISDLPSTETAIVLDFDEQSGSYRDLLGVNRSPAWSTRGEESKRYNGSALLREFGVTQIRMHSAGIDLCAVYTDDTVLDMTDTDGDNEVFTCVGTAANPPPHFFWSVNDPSTVDDPSNYDFSDVDELLRLLDEADAELYLRLGEAYNGPNDTDDPLIWATVARNIYLHLIGEFGPEGPTEVPLFIEIFNEPDGMFWVGSNETFFEIYRETFDQLADLGDVVSSPVGGAGFVHDCYRNFDVPDSLVSEFIPAVTPARLDFFSAHYYGECDDETLANMVNWLDTVRAEIDEDGLVDTPIHISEWNTGLGKQCGDETYDQQRMQSFTAGALIIMQDARWDIEAAHFFSGVPVMGLFNSDADADTFNIRPSAWAFYLHSHLLNATLGSSLSCVSGDCVDAVEAVNQEMSPIAISAATDDGYLGVVVNDTDEEIVYTLQLKGSELTGRHLFVTTPPAVDTPGQVLGSEQDDGYLVPVSADLDAALALAIREDLGELVVNDGSAEVVLTIPRFRAQLVEVE